jgi:hypothetical protein
VAARRQSADHLAGTASRAAAPGRRRLAARALGHAGRRLRRRRHLPARRRRPLRPRGAPLLVLFHGLEGSVGQPLCAGLRQAEARGARGWAMRCRTSAAARASSTWRRAPTTRATSRRSAGCWRGCALQRARRCWRSASRWAAMRCCAGPRRPATARRHGRRRGGRRVLAAGPGGRGHAIGRGFNRLVYTRMFLSTMKPKALAKWQQHPGLFDRERVAAARTLYEFDDAFTAPLHGFAARGLLGARLGQAAPGAAAHPGAGAQCAQRPLRAGGLAARAARGGPPSRCGSRRTAGMSAFRTAAFRASAGLPRPCATGWRAGLT